MLAKLVEQIAETARISPEAARAALGVVLNASDRQGAAFASAMFASAPGARTLAAEIGARTGAPTGVIARLIERTPGGRMAVVHQTTRALHAEGLGPAAVAGVFRAISGFCQKELGISGGGHIGDVFGSPSSAAESLVA